MPKPLHDVTPSERANSREREPIMHRTAPEVAPMVVGRAVAHDASRGRIVAGIAMLVVGIAAVAAGVIGLGTRVGPTAVAVRDTDLDPVAVYFMGTAGSVGELVLVIALIALIPIGIVLGAIGYRRITDDGPSLPGVHVSSSPAATMNIGGEV
ncbi:hypothetical protein [Agrococcus sp. ARC_14]|uniref:hypothetical protein n=1 Tax=Agrococcus sp. ARC_14 TaxID=2919927 RepID=UPI001F058DD6|nr:hypothetical protein [Agrococcus sp. ARC_14]MCH1881849.1 hypothetical protein [Agrococcus sp. ARC_14]